jgi:hypothetical protein
VVKAIAAVLLATSIAYADPDEVIEVAGSAPDEAPPPSYSLAGDDIRQLAGANNDTLRAVEAMPGVARTPMSFGALVLRGASPRDSSVYLDGVEVPLAFHFGGVTSFYPSTMLGDVELVPGGFDVEYGRAQGGIVTMTTRAPRGDRWRVAGEISGIQSSASAEGPLPGGGAMIVGVRQAYLDEVAGPFVTRDTPLPRSSDAQLRATWGDPRELGQLSPTVFASRDEINNRMLDLTVDAAFVRIAVPYLRQAGATTLHVVPWLGWTDVAFAYGGSLFEQLGIPAEKLARPTWPGGVRADVTRDLPWGDVRAGVDIEATRASREVGNIALDSAASWLDLAAWTEALARVGPLAVRPGVRVEHYGLTDEVVADPRVTADEQLAPGVTLRAALGRFHQPPTVADVDPANGNPALHSSYTDQISLGVGVELPYELHASLAGYYTYGRDIGVPVAHGLAPPPDLGGFGPTFAEMLEKELGTSSFRANLGRARDEGIELALRRSSGRWFGMLSYTLSRAQRTDSPPAGWRPYELDQRHDLNAAASVHLASWQLGARFTAVSGEPYSPITSDMVVHPWAATLPAYVQLDLRVDRRWHRRWGDVDVYLDIQNATDRHNLEGYTFDPAANRQVPVPGLPILPFVGVELLAK